MLSQKEKVDFDKLPLQHLLKEDNGSKIEEQYRRIILINWSEEVFGGNAIPDESGQFWAKIRSYQNSQGKFAFEDLANYALACLTLPISNATVERIFSSVTWLKNKNRNRINTETLDTLLRIKTHLKYRGICCTKFKITEKMLAKFNSSIYINEVADNVNEDIEGTIPEEALNF